MSSPSTTHFKLRLWLAFSGILAIGLILAARLYYWQVVEYDRLALLAESQVSIEKPIPARRGDILTRDNLRVATDVFLYTVRVDPRDIPDKDAFAKALSPLVNQAPEEILSKLNTSPVHVVIANDLPVETGKAIQDFKSQNEFKHAELGLVSLQVEVRSVRQYPAGAFAAPVIGYVNAARRPAYGVEQYKDDELRGVDGKLRGSGGVLHDIIPMDLPSQESPIGGANVTLTLNSAMQRIAEAELARAVRETRAESGTVVVINPKTGEILALAVYPTADLNSFYDPANSNRYVNTAVSAQHEPGSVFKVVTMAAGLDARSISTSSTFDDNGQVIFGGVTVRNHDYIAPGHVNLVQVMQKSLNVEASKIAIGLGVERFYQYVRKFGFGALTRVDLAGEVAGDVKSPGDGRWRDSDLVTNSYGQGISVTPLQMIAAISVVANDGTLMRPYIVHQLQRSDGTLIKSTPQPVRQVISPETARIMTQILSDAILVESTNKAIVPGYRVAGKTGTAQIPGIGGYDPVWTIASFAGYLPADDPRFAILVKLDKPQTSEWGSQVASPVFASVARQLVALIGLPPDSVRLASGR